MVELTYGQLFVKEPCLALVSCDPDSSIISVDDEIGIGGMNPECMVVWMDAIVRDDHFEILTCIIAFGDHLIDQPEPVFILRIAGNFLKIERSCGNKLRVAVHERPGLSTIITFVQTIFCGFHQRIDTVGVAAGNGQSDPAEITSRQTFFFT